MRVIKLSSNDPDMLTRDMVIVFFREKLAKRNPSGQFFLTKGRVSETGISPGERLLFTYQGECIYQARAASGRATNENANKDQYPFYFCVDTKTIVDAVGNLQDVVAKLALAGSNIVNTQSWPIIDDSTTDVQDKLDGLLGKV